MNEKFLNRAYGKRGARAVKAHYDAWADSYDTEIAENGYATPGRCAAALAATGLSRSAAILDLGCGTGLSGAALAAEGFTVIDGTDLSPAMLEKAEGRNLYRQLFPARRDGRLPAGPYQAICAVGVISPGAAPISMLTTALDLLPPGGALVMSLNDHGLADASYTDGIAAIEAAGLARLRLQEYGPHLPGINLNSTIYVFEKN